MQIIGVLFAQSKQMFYFCIAIPNKTLHLHKNVNNCFDTANIYHLTLKIQKLTNKNTYKQWD